MKFSYVSIIALALTAPLAAHGPKQAATVELGPARAQVSGQAMPRIVKEWEAAWNTGDGDRMAALFKMEGGY